MGDGVAHGACRCRTPNRWPGAQVAIGIGDLLEDGAWDGCRVTNKFYGASETELRAASTVRRGVALVDQTRLFPHRGRVRLQGRELVLEEWQTIDRSQIVGLALTYTDAYGRFTAGGSRGQFPSLGFFGGWGKPVVIDRADGAEQIYLLINYNKVTGVNQARHWFHRLEGWLEGARP